MAAVWRTFSKHFFYLNLRETYEKICGEFNGNVGKVKKSLAQEVRQKSDISEHRSKGWG